jgi:hypothetical protein
MDHPEWLIGTAAPGDDEDAPEWLAHLAFPRFVCRVVDELTEGPALSSFVFSEGDWALCDFVFFDPVPEGEALRDLCRLAIAQLD